MWATRPAVDLSGFWGVVLAMIGLTALQIGIDVCPNLPTPTGDKSMAPRALLFSALPTVEIAARIGQVGRVGPLRRYTGRGRS